LTDAAPLLQVDLLTLFPQMFAAITDFGVSGRAVERGLVRVDYWNPRDYTESKHRRVDDRPYGGGPGMVMQVQPLRDALAAARAANPGGKVIYLSPQGRPLDQTGVEALAKEPHLVLIAGRYEGIDERFIEREVDAEWSIGDYVLSGGELAAMVLLDAVIRQLPGALGHEESAEQDSFAQGLLDHPHYTRPEVIDGAAVPEVLVGGDHSAIARWRMKQALGRTWLRRPELLERVDLDRGQQALLQEYIQEHEAEAKN